MRFPMHNAASADDADVREDGPGAVADIIIYNIYAISESSNVSIQGARSDSDSWLCKRCLFIIL